jgi:hypothetical protein
MSAASFGRTRTANQGPARGSFNYVSFPYNQLAFEEDMDERLAK